MDLEVWHVDNIPHLTKIRSNIQFTKINNNLFNETKYIKEINASILNNITLITLSWTVNCWTFHTIYFRIALNFVSKEVVFSTFFSCIISWTCILSIIKIFWVYLRYNKIYRQLQLNWLSDPWSFLPTIRRLGAHTSSVSFLHVFITQW